jgi:hypothetical protein
MTSDVTRQNQNMLSTYWSAAMNMNNRKYNGDNKNNTKT